MDLSRADLALLVSLDALLSERGVTAAARRVGITQPAMSAQLSRLRDLFGDPLLVGNAHGMVPTALAQDIEAPLRAHLAGLTGLVRDRRSFDPATAKRDFRIIATDHLHSDVILPLVSALSVEAPGLRIAALPQPTDRAYGLEHDTDLVVTSHYLTDPDLPARRLYVDDFAVIWREGHPRAQAPIDVETFCACDHVLVSTSGGSFRGSIDGTLERAGHKRRITLSVPGFLLALNAVRTSDRIAVIPRRLAEANGHGLTLSAPPMPFPEIPILSSWHPRMTRDPGHQWLRNRIVDLVAS